MSLILAIEPDRRQVAHLISIVRHVKGAELILADTTERALESIGNNVPDLILVPALLSPQDDAALAAALRVIATAAHVQMLTIPTFAAPKPRARRGVLSAFRRKPADDPPLEGCDPKVFAEEIASYLERATEERAAAQSYEDGQETLRAEPQPAAAPARDETLADFEAGGTPPAYADDRTQTTSPATAESSAASTESIAEGRETPAEPWAAAESEPLEPALEPRPAAVSAAPEPSFQPTVPIEEPEMVPDTPPAAAERVPEMAFDEFVAALEHTTPLEDVLPRAAAAPHADDGAHPPAFEDLLADFERANLPVIEEVHAEQWMAEGVDSTQADHDRNEDDEDHLDIDLSVELDAVLSAAEPARAPETTKTLKPFESVVPVERAEPPPLAAWQMWPRLDGTAPEASVEKRASNGNGNGANGKGHHAEPEKSDESLVAEFQQVAEFEEALDGEKPEPLDPVLPVERVEPMPLAAWNRWPKLEGVAAESYQEPIAPRKPAAKPEWVELMRSLREDIARRRAELAASGPIAPATQRSHRPRAASETTVPSATPSPAPAADQDKKLRPKRPRPMEDEWGLFDPEQCGFAALLDKLDEITAALPNAQSRRQTR